MLVPYGLEIKIMFSGYLNPGHTHTHTHTQHTTMECSFAVLNHHTKGIGCLGANLLLTLHT